MSKLAVWLLSCGVCLTQAHAQPAKTDAEETWLQLTADIQKLYRAGRFRDGLAKALEREPIAVAAFGRVHAKYAETINDIGLLQKTLGQFSEAERNYRHAIEIDRVASGVHHPFVAKKLNTLGNLLRETARHLEAELAFKEAISIGEMHPHANLSELASWHNNLASTYYDLARYGEAEEQFEKALKISAEADGPRHENRARYLNNFSNVLVAKGKYTRAESLIKESLEIDIAIRGPDDPLVAFDLSSLALIYRNQGLFANALPHLERALALRRQHYGDKHPFVAASMVSLASVLRPLGRAAEAEQLYIAALALDEVVSGQESIYVADDLISLAGFYLHTGRPDLALPPLAKALEINRKKRGPQHPEVAQTLLTQGETLLRLSRAREALSAFQDARNIIGASFGKGHVLDARAQAGAGRALLQLGRSQDALSELRAASAYYRDDAESRFPNRITRSDDTPDRRLALTAAIDAAWRIGNREPTTVEDTLVWAQLATSSAADGALLQQAERQSGAPLAGDIRSVQDLEEARAAAEAGLYLAVSSNWTDDLRQARIADQRKRVADLDDKLREAVGRLDAAGSRHTRYLRQVPQSIASIQSRLRDDEALVLFLDTDERFTPLPAETFVWIVTTTDVRWERSDLGTAALQREVAALRCGLDAKLWERPSDWPQTGANEAQPRSAELAPGAQCQSLVQAEPRTTLVGLAPVTQLPFDAARAHRLYRSLLGGVEELIRDKHLLVVPSGPLTSLPFSVLVTRPPAQAIPERPEDYRTIAWLGIRQPITVLPAVSSIQALRGSQASADQPGRRMIGIGNPLLQGRTPQDAENAQKAARLRFCAERRRGSLSIEVTAGNRGPTAGFASVFKGQHADIVRLREWSPLPETADELCEIANLLNVPDSDILLGGRAREGAIKDLSAGGLLANYRIVHFATHGALTGEVTGIAEPGLVLTPPDTISEDSRILEHDDGFLSASEIATLRLNADWVILSACNTAGAAGENAEALSGMARAFFYAGARSLLVSHWEVGSQVAVSITTRALAHLDRRPAIGRAEALRQALEGVVISEEPWFAHPSQWAPFVLVGEGAAARQK